MSEVLEGLVAEIDGTYAKVRPKRHNECGDCQACFAQDLIVLAYNPKKAGVGQTVRYTQAPHGMLLIAWVLFVQPLLAVFLGVGLGQWLGPLVPVPPALTTGVAVVLFFGAAVAFILWFDRRYKLNHSNFARIVEIIA